jgi:membrane dipeptidase
MKNGTVAVVALFAALILESCASGGAARRVEPIQVIDTHIDAPSRLVSGWEPVGESVPAFDFDYNRARAGGLTVAFMSIFTASELEDSLGKSKLAADREIEAVRKMIATWPDRFEFVGSPGEIREKRHSGKVLLAMGMENGSPLDDDLALVQRYYDMGIRYVTLAHAKWNHLADGSYDTTRHWNGVSPFGRDVIREMNRLGMMVDVSHLTDSAAFQAISLSRAPVIASHSSCRAFTPGFERNASDELIRAIAATGGVIQITFGIDFVNGAANKVNGARWDSLSAYFKAQGWDPEGQKADSFGHAYWTARPPMGATVEQVADHIDHVVRLVGIDHVGLGSDFDGVGGLLPEGLKDVGSYPNLFAVLRRRGYTDADLRKIGSENLLRVWEAVEHAAAGR